MASDPITKLTEQEYLAIERAAQFRSEFIDGEMFAMAGASKRHGLIQRNLQGELYVALRGGKCGPFGPDSRVRISAESYTYPDVSVVCDQSVAGGDEDNLVNPVVIFEILSPTTEKYDRGAKFQLYRTIESLQEYILVNQDQVRIEQFTRQADGTWKLRDLEGPEAELKIDSIGVAIALRRIYDKTGLLAVTAP